jgi:hypothetical protein
MPAADAGGVVDLYSNRRPTKEKFWSAEAAEQGLFYRYEKTGAR